MDAALPNSVCCPEGLRLQFFLWVLRVCVCVSVCVCVCVWGFMAPGIIGVWCAGKKVGVCFELKSSQQAF